MKWSDVQTGDVIEHEKDLLLVLHVSEKEIVVLALDVQSNYNEASAGVVETWPYGNGANSVVKGAVLLFRRGE